MQKTANWNSYICLDLETTGLEPKVDDIIEIAMIKVLNGEITERFEQLVYTPTELSDIVTFLTGLKNTDLEKASEWRQLKDRVQEFIGDFPLVGHNIAFDVSFLREKGMKLSNPQWDTYYLSTLLYPELPSHSLETNSLYFNLNHDNSHRAMSDVLACHELWQILMSSFPELTKEQKSQIASIASRSTWELAHFFAEDRHPFKVSYNLLQGDLPLVQNRSSEINWNGSQLIFCRGNDPMSFISTDPNEKRLFVAGFNHTLEQLHQVLPSAVLFAGPNRTFSHQKVESIRSKPTLSMAETILLLRLTVWPDKTDTGEMALSHAERFESWKEVQADEAAMLNERDCPAYKTYHLALKADSVITSQYFLISHPELAHSFDRIVILEPQLLKQNATNAFGSHSDLQHWTSLSADANWKQKGKELYQLLEEMMRDTVQGSPYNEKVPLSPEITSTKQFYAITTLVRELSDPKHQPQLPQIYTDFFENTEPKTVRWLNVHPQYGIGIHTAPLHVTPLLHDRVIQGKPLTVISNTTSRFGFSKDIPITEIPEPKQVHMVLPELSDIRGSKKEGQHAPLIRHIKELIPGLRGNTAVIFGSKAKLRDYFFQIYDPGQKCDFFGEDIGAGTGKLLDNYRASEASNKVIFLTYRNLRVYRPEHMDFDTIIVTTIPFDPPGDPVVEARSALLSNPFGQLALPVAKQNLVEITTHFNRNLSRPNTLHLIDPRFQQSSYGKEFVELFEE